MIDNFYRFEKLLYLLEVTIAIPCEKEYKEMIKLFESDIRYLWDRGYRCGWCMHSYTNEYEGNQCELENDMYGECKDYKHKIINYCEVE